MRECDYCDKEIITGYLEYDMNIICENCIDDLYTKEELNKEYEDENIFWTEWYSEKINNLKKGDLYDTNYAR